MRILYIPRRLIDIKPDTRIRIFFDASGSMGTTLPPLNAMRDGNLKTALLPMYNNDSALYDQMVTVESNYGERTFDMMDNLHQPFPEGKVIFMVFQDESSPSYHTNVVPDPPTSYYLSDINTLRTRLGTFAPSYYRGIIFQVNGDNQNNQNTFPLFLQAVQNGIGGYAGVNGLSDKPEIGFVYGVSPGITYASDPTYYLNLILGKLRQLGYNV